MDEPPGSPDTLFAVTTRSHLRSPLYFGHMMLASLRIRRQLAATGEVVGWASIVAGPSEFWTITVWSSRHDMHQFMSSGAHDEIMWLFSKWLKSFWLMRWRPGPVELGRWKGLTMAQPDQVLTTASAGGSRDRALEQALEFLPKLRSSMEADGSVGYETTANARRRRSELKGSGGLVVHISGPWWKSLGILAELRSLRDHFECDPDLLRAVVGISRPGQVYLLTVWRDREAGRRMLASDRVAGLSRRYPGLWANEWAPENEFGHWDGLRLRRTRRRSTLAMPVKAALLDD